MLRDTNAAREVLYRWRKRQRLLQQFGRFAEDVWIILLRIYADESSGRTSVTSITSGLHISATSTLRQLAILEERGAIVSRCHPTDRRLRLLGLTDEVADEITRLLVNDAEPLERFAESAHQLETKVRQIHLASRDLLIELRKMEPVNTKDAACHPIA